MRKTWLAIRVSVGGILISAGLLTSWLALPRTVAACSCAMPSLAAIAAEPTGVVFSGLVGVRDPIGLQVAVDRWFAGRGVAPLVHLDPAYLDRDSAGCGIAAPPAGSRWLFGGTREQGSDLISINLCSPQGDLGTAEGQTLLADAVAAFPGVPIPTDPGPSAPPAVPSAPAAPASPSGPVTNEPLATIGSVVPFLAIGVSAVLVVGLVAWAVAFARRRRAPD